MTIVLDIALDRVLHQAETQDLTQDLWIESIGPHRLGIPKEVTPGECRVAATPETAKTLQHYGFAVWVESGAGLAASFSDQAYRGVGCQIAVNAEQLWQQCDIVLKVRPPTESETQLLSENGTLISFVWPSQNPELVQRLADRHATVLAMDAVPRISRAQKLDALSSMANIAGYRAVIEAANHFGHFFMGQITAAGKVPPAKVLVIGAGVAGLAAVATAKSLGAIVRAFDTRSIVREQIQSLGAEYLEVALAEDGTGQGGYGKTMSPEFIAAEMALFLAQAQEVDIIITTALIPGKPAPKLITREMIAAMKPGSVVVDLAAEQGGNCELTEPDRITHSPNGVTIIGFTDLPSRMAAQSSELYGTNLCHLLDDMGRNDHYHVDLNDEVIRGTVVLYQGDRLDPLPPKPAPVKPEVVAAVNLGGNSIEPEPPQQDLAKLKGTLKGMLWMSLMGIMFVAIGLSAPASFLSHFTVFVLACFLGWQVIWTVKPALHTPLMSVTNAISGIIILGGVLQLSDRLSDVTTVLGAIAIFIGTINIVGGFWVTRRMLNLFQNSVPEANGVS